MSNWTEISCGQCGVAFCLKDETLKHLKASSQTFWCPFGHERHYPQGESRETKLARERDRLKQNAAYLEDELRRAHEKRDAAERRASAARGQITKLKKRAAAGVCPCCNRTFVDLKRHMTGKHPGFIAEEIAGAEGATLQ